MKRKALFVDRDGIVNRSPGPGYVERWEDFHLLPEFVEVLRVARDLGFETVVVTNQRGVARGLMTQAELDRIHRNLCRTLREQYGLTLRDVFACTHHEDDGCACRKPKPGMLLKAASAFALDLPGSLLVGDQASDLAAGRAAGVGRVQCVDDDGGWSLQ